MSQEKILLGPIAKSDLQMLIEYEFKYKIILDINLQFILQPNQNDIKFIYLRIFYNLYTFLRGFGVLDFRGLKTVSLERLEYQQLEVVLNAKLEEK